MLSVRRFPPALAGLALLLAACAPPLDWREVRPRGAALTVLLPCKPERRSRQVVLADAPVQMEVLACTAEGTTWGLTSGDLGEARRVGPALAALRAARIANLDGRETEARAPQAAGSAGSAFDAQSLRLRVEGRRPDGQAVTEQSLLFARGTRVFHAVALGGAPSQDALDTFFGSLAQAP